MLVFQTGETSVDQIRFFHYHFDNVDLGEEDEGGEGRKVVLLEHGRGWKDRLLHVLNHYQINFRLKPLRDTCIRYV